MEYINHKNIQNTDNNKIEEKNIIRYIKASHKNLNQIVNFNCWLTLLFLLCIIKLYFVWVLPKVDYRL